MAEPLSKRFILELEPARDRLYAAALARAATPRAAEALLQRTVRDVFQSFAAGTLKTGGLPAVEAELGKDVVAGAAVTDAAMPADTWARLTATVQVEAARSGAVAGKAINPESVQMMADPLLAPKKSGAGEDPFDGLNLSPPSRFMIAAGIAIVLGLGLSIYILSRRSASHPTTSTAPATSAAISQAVSTAP